MLLYKIRTKNDLEIVKSMFPTSVADEAERVIAVLDENYENGKGGFVAVVENELDLEELRHYHLDCQTDVCEFADVLGDSGFVSVLYIVGTEFAINVIMPLSIKPAIVTLSN